MSTPDDHNDCVTSAGSSRYAETSRWRIHYNEAGSGPVVVLLHGSGPGASAWSNFAPNIQALAQSFRVIAMDFPGWGASDPLLADTASLITEIVDAVRLLMDHLGLERAALVGNSLGGIAAQLFATLYPDRVTHLVTMGAPAPEGPPLLFAPAGLSEGLRTLFDAYREPTHDNFRRLVEVMVFDPEYATDDLVRERQANAVMSEVHLKNFPENVARMASLATPEIRGLGARLTELSRPALIIHGRDDRVIAVENGLRLASLIPNSELLIFSRCGHWAQLEHARRFNSIVTAFIADS